MIYLSKPPSRRPARGARGPLGASVNLWDDVLAKVESKVNRHSFATWFRPTTSLGLQGSTLHVRVPNAQFKDWLAKNYQGVITEALDELGRGEVHVLFDCDAEAGTVTETAAAADKETPTLAVLNPKYTFESFVVGSSNQFAHAAARAVAEIPSKSYNPLFLYGGVGLGKTHLMHAIGHYIQARNRSSLQPAVHLVRALHQRDDQRHPHSTGCPLPAHVPRDRRPARGRHPVHRAARTGRRKSSSTPSTRFTTRRSRS